MPCLKQLNSVQQPRAIWKLCIAATTNMAKLLRPWRWNLLIAQKKTTVASQKWTIYGFLRNLEAGIKAH